MREFVKASYIQQASSRDIDGTVSVGIRAEPADATGKKRLSLSIRASGIGALRTLLAGILWVNSNTGNAKAFRLILNLCSQVEKRPIMQPMSLGLPGLNSLPDMRQVFKCNRHGQALSLHNNGFGDRMIGNFLKPRLFAGQGVKPSLCPPASSRLEHGTLGSIPNTNRFNMGTTERGAGTISGKRHNSEVDAKDTLRNQRTGVVDVHDARYVPFLIDVQQVCLTLTKWQQGALARSALVWNCLASIQGPKIRAVPGHQSKNLMIVGLGGPSTKDPKHFGGIGEFVRICHFCNAPHRGLSRQAECFTNCIIVCFMKIILPKDLCVEGASRQPVARLVTSFQRGFQCAMLLSSWRQFQMNHKFHVPSMGCAY